MVKTRIKGNKNVRKCIELLTSEGWLVDKVEKTGRFIKDKDLFNLMDLVAVGDDTTLFVQVKSNRPGVHKRYQEFANKYAGPHLLVRQYVWVDRKGWKVFKYEKEGYSVEKYF